MEPRAKAEKLNEIVDKDRTDTQNQDSECVKSPGVRKIMIHLNIRVFSSASIVRRHSLVYLQPFNFSVISAETVRN